MLKIFHLPGSRSNRLVWLAEEMGLPYELKLETFGQFSEDFLEANPARALPAIRDGGVAMGESIAIMQYMMGVYGPTRLELKPGAPRYADYLQFLVFGEGSMAAFLNPVFITAFTAPDDQKQNFTLEVAKNLFRGRLRSLDTQLAKGDYLAGEFTAADISVGWSLDVAAGIGLDADYSPAVKGYLARLHARPAYQDAIAS
jgi:glutathione S-transferase